MPDLVQPGHPLPVISTTGRDLTLPVVEMTKPREWPVLNFFQFSLTLHNSVKLPYVTIF